MGLADRLRDSCRGRAARGLCPHRIAGVTVLGAPAGSAAADPRGTGSRPTTAGRRPGMARPRREGSDAPTLPAGYAEEHGGGDVHRLLQHHHLWHGGQLDAAVPRAGAALVHRHLRYLLYMVGTIYAGDWSA